MFLSRKAIFLPGKDVFPIDKAVFAVARVVSSIVNGVFLTGLVVLQTGSAMPSTAKGIFLDCFAGLSVGSAASEQGSDVLSTPWHGFLFVEVMHETGNARFEIGSPRNEHCLSPALSGSGRTANKTGAFASRK